VELGRRLVFADWFDAFVIDTAARSGRGGEAIAEAARAAATFGTTGSIFAAGMVHRAWAVALLAQPEPPLDEARTHLTESLRLFNEGQARVEAARTQLVLDQLSG
jgi:hypothetical protein